MMEQMARPVTRGWQQRCLTLFVAVVSAGCLEKLPESAFGVATGDATGDASIADSEPSQDVMTGEIVEDGAVVEVIDAETDSTGVGEVGSPPDTQPDTSTDRLDDVNADGDTVLTDSSGDVASETTDGSDVTITDAGVDVSNGTDSDVATTCTANAVSCIGNVIAICNAAGTSLSPGEDCETTGKSCKNGVCVAPQQGFDGHGGFSQTTATAKSGFRVIQQGFGSRIGCNSGFCARGGLRP